jgi:ribulose-5-phosphate 4-epimerase/fuculose-1-phosphate aldolase
MSNLDQILQDLVIANRILAREEVVDAYGHVSIRHPDNPKRFFLARSLAPELVERGDIVEHGLDAEAVGNEARALYLERFIHGAIYEARPDVMAVVHHHSPNVVPFTVSKHRLKPIMHMCGPIGTDIPNWDIRHKFGDTNLLVTSMEIGRDFAQALGTRTVALMRGHGGTVVGQSVREVVFTSVYMEVNAAMLLKVLPLGEVTYLSDGEVAAITKGRAGFTLERAWEGWCDAVDRAYVSRDWNMGAGFSKTDA